MKIGFIGLGNMATAILGGILGKGLYPPEEIIGWAKTEKTREHIREAYGIRIAEDNAEVAARSEILVLAVKPVFAGEVIAQLRGSLKPDTVIYSVMAGKSLEWLDEAFGGGDLAIVRAMPNTPALVGEGCTGVCVNGNVTQEEQERALEIFGSFGRSIQIPERLIDTVGAVSGSSPAFVFLFLEALADAAVAGGMPRAQAYEFAGQAVLGSAKLLLETGKHPGELKDMVCSPGGTTIEGVRVLEERGLRAAVMDAVAAAIEKTKHL